MDTASRRVLILRSLAFVSPLPGQNVNQTFRDESSASNAYTNSEFLVTIFPRPDITMFRESNDCLTGIYGYFQWTRTHIHNFGEHIWAKWVTVYCVLYSISETKSIRLSPQRDPGHHLFYPRSRRYHRCHRRRSHCQNFRQRHRR